MLEPTLHDRRKPSNLFCVAEHGNVGIVGREYELPFLLLIPHRRNDAICNNRLSRSSSGWSTINGASDFKQEEQEHGRRFLAGRELSKFFPSLGLLIADVQFQISFGRHFALLNFQSERRTSTRHPLCGAL